jgi:type II secretory pathway component PulF
MEELIIQDTPTEVAAQDKKISLSLESVDAWLTSKQKINTKQKVIFFRLLATMVNAGLPMLKSLSILQKQETNQVLLHIYTKIIEQIK